MNESFSSSKTAYMLSILTRFFRSANRDDSKKDIIQWFITFSLADTMYEKYWHHGEQMFFEALHFCTASKKIMLMKQPCKIPIISRYLFLYIIQS